MGSTRRAYTDEYRAHAVALAGAFHARATSTTIRTHLITVRGRQGVPGRLPGPVLGQVQGEPAGGTGQHAAVCRPPGHRPV